MAVILYDSGLALEWGKVRGRARRVVPRLVIWGVPVTMAFAAVLAGPLLGMSAGAALMTGAILVVSGPTVVGPLLAFVRPSDRLQRILSWEGSLIDPVGGILGAVVFHAVLASTSGGVGHPLGQFLLSAGIGAAGAVVGVAVLWLCLCKLDLDDLLSTTSQLACVVGVAAVCDIVRDDAGLIAAILMGLAVANLRVFNVPAKRPFFETLVQLIIGVLFVSISATVTPASLQHLVLPTLGLVAVLVLVTRPLVAFLATIRTELTRGERAFTGWMAPRGIVAAATASTFGADAGRPPRRRRVQDPARHLPGHRRHRRPVRPDRGPGGPAARRHPPRPHPPAAGRRRPVGHRPGPRLPHRRPGRPHVGPLRGQRTQIKQAGLELAPGEQLASAVAQGAELEGVTAILLLTGEDHFNALAATTLAGNSDTPVYRLAPRHGDACPPTPPAKPSSPPPSPARP